MIDLFDLPHIENDTYYLFIDNVLGACSMVTIMRKDNGPINGKHGLSTAMYGFITNNFDDCGNFEYHYSLDDSLSREFSEKTVLEAYEKFRTQAIEK